MVDNIAVLWHTVQCRAHALLNSNMRFRGWYTCYTCVYELQGWFTELRKIHLVAGMCERMACVMGVEGRDVYYVGRIDAFVALLGGIMYTFLVSLSPSAQLRSLIPS